jgi:hypothetical protein
VHFKSVSRRTPVGMGTAQKPQLRRAGAALPTRFSRTARVPPRHRDRNAASPKCGACATSFIGKAKNRGVKSSLRVTRCVNDRQHPRAAELQNNSTLPTLGRRRTGLAPATGSTLEKWEGALYAEAVRCVLLFGREIRTQIPGEESGVLFSSESDKQAGLQ